MLKIQKYSFGIGDRFAMQGVAQLRAIMKARDGGFPVVPVWNKSNREHQIVKTVPSDNWKKAKAACIELGYTDLWYADADHINLSNVKNYIEYSNFFTLDVADYIGKKPDPSEAKTMINKLKGLPGKMEIKSVDLSVKISEKLITEIVSRFYLAIKQASLIYRAILAEKGRDNFVTEISMDEVQNPQIPVELFFILLMIDYFNIPAQTIAPKFTGRFNKGVDYQGDLQQFHKEFEEDLLVIDHAINITSLPKNLKLSIHSGSDKFSIYPVIGKLIRKHKKGIHVKTAGTTWLEEVIGLAMSDGEGLKMAKYIYTEAYRRMDELCGPYATVIDIDAEKLPSPENVNSWSAEKFSNTLRHIPGHPDYDPMFRQLIHVGYKIAAELGNSYLEMLEANKEIVAVQVTENIYERHLKRLWELT